MLDVERFRGCLLGLAVGDALGTTLEFQSPGAFHPIEEIVGGGPFRLGRGQWTDDTAMALCLADSLIQCRGFDVEDQLTQYVRWWKEGRWSCTGICFDIGNTTRQALEDHRDTGRLRRAEDATEAGNGSLMRLAPVPMFFANEPERAMHFARESSYTTHGAVEAADACAYYAGLIVGALRGVDKETLLRPEYSPAGDYWTANPASARVREVMRGPFKDKEPPRIVGSGYVVKSLEAALWAFHKSTSFREGALLAVNLGDDADTTGAIYGQLAGAYYGIRGIPESWRDVIFWRDRIEEMSTELWRFAVGARAAAT